MKNSKTVMSRYIGLLGILATMLVFAVASSVVVVVFVGFAAIQQGSNPFTFLGAAGLLGLGGVSVLLIVVGMSIYISWVVLAAYLQTILNIEENTEDAAGALLELGGSIDRLSNLLEKSMYAGYIASRQQPPPGQAG